MSGAPTGWTTPRTNWTSADAITAADLNRAEGNSLALDEGTRTLDQALASPANVGTLRQLLSWFAGRFRAITGASNWWEAPATTLVAAQGHIAAVAPVHGSSVAATPNSLAQRDVAGRLPVADGVAAGDAVNRGQLDGATTRLAYVHDDTEVGVTGITETARKTFRLVKHVGMGINVRQLWMAAEMRVSAASTGTARLWRVGDGSPLLTATVTATANTLVVVGPVDVSAWSDGIYTMELRLFNSTTATTFNRYFELYVR